MPAATLALLVPSVQQLGDRQLEMRLLSCVAGAGAAQGCCTCLLCD